MKNDVIATYRGNQITEAMLSECLINGEEYSPNGTGPGELFGSKVVGRYARWLLKRFPSDRFQVRASCVHDIMYKAGGDWKDRRYADSEMLRISSEAVKRSYSRWNPLRYLLLQRMKLNWKMVREYGNDSFEYHRSSVVITEV